MNRSLSKTGKQPDATKNQVTQAAVVRTPPLPVVRLPSNLSVQEEKFVKPADKDRPKINVTRMESNVSNEVKPKTLKNIISSKQSPSISAKRSTKAQEK